MNNALLDTLLDVLKKAEVNAVEGIKLNQWRITLDQTQRINLGVKNNVAGSVYTPPSYSNMERGEIFLIWEDGKCTRSKVQNVADSGGGYWSKQLSLWRMTAYQDHHQLSIPIPQTSPQVLLANEDISHIISFDSKTIFDQQQQIISDRPPKALTNASLMAAWTRNLIYTSTGIAQDYPESRYAVSWSFDSQISARYAERRLPTSQQWQALWDDSVSRYNLLQTPSKPIEDKTVVVLAPSVVDQMVEHFILSNFRGENVLEKQSKFAVQDFHSRKLLFDEGLSLELDPLQPERWASYIMTPEGIGAVCTLVVDKGCLVTPYLNIKDAKRWQAAPTAIPMSSSAMVIKHQKQTKWNEQIRKIQDGVLVMSVLGLHTQNPVTGGYSLSAPSCLRIENGNLTGRTDIRINGNIWEVMKAKDTVYAVSQIDHHPYIITNSHLEAL